MATVEPGPDPHRGPDLLGGASRPRLRGSTLRHPRIPLHARRRAHGARLHPALARHPRQATPERRDGDLHVRQRRGLHGPPGAPCRRRGPFAALLAGAGGRAPRILRHRGGRGAHGGGDARHLRRPDRVERSRAGAGRGRARPAHAGAERARPGRVGERRAAFLAQASATLSASLDYDSTLKSVADLAVPHLADWCAVCVLDAEGEVRLVAAAHPDPSKVPLAWDESRRYLLRLSAPHGPGRVIHTGEPELVSEISDSLLRAVARGAEHLALLRGLGFVSYMAVPLSARGRTL